VRNRSIWLNLHILIRTSWQSFGDKAFIKKENKNERLYRTTACIQPCFKALVVVGCVNSNRCRVRFLYSQLQPRVYRATATVLIGQIFQSTSPDRADIQTSEDLAQLR
jgi:hypothetical protein